uniref:Major facilitator superfamily domain containing 6-like n=1 Tax=Paramormyrops kingsleyae TaxID=1676925 RepID=A0A3B3RRA7_9TELE
MEKQRKSPKRRESVESRNGLGGSANTEGEDVVSMADSSITIEDLEGELSRINRIRDLLVRRESELRYMMDDIQLCKEITRLKRELHKLVSAPDAEKSSEDREKETELLWQIQRLVETRDFLVDDVELERLREREEDKEMADFLQSRFPRSLMGKGISPSGATSSKERQSSSPLVPKTGLTLLKECCGFNCTVM